MTMYTVPQHASRKRSLSRRTQIFIITALLVPFSLIAIDNIPASAAAKYTTLQDVQDAINAALAPINNAIASLQNTQATHTSQISDLQNQQQTQATAINSLQSATPPAIRVYDANGHELGLLISHGGDEDQIYSPQLNEVIYIADNAEATQDTNDTGIFSSGIGNNPNTIYYLSTDCSGTAYTYNYMRSTNAVMPISPTENYTFHQGETAKTIVINSSKSFNSSACNLLTPQPITAWQLYPVTLPFPTPIAEPIQFKYQ